MSAAAGVDQALKHRRDFFALLNEVLSAFFGEKFQFLCQVALGSQFGRRALGNPEESDYVHLAVPFVAFGNVRRNGNCGTGHLIFEDVFL